ncbi:MAG: hypothetical protein ACOYBE_00470 [Blautia sp.]|jgi:hypothetical protein
MMGKVRRIIEGVLVAGLWGVITTMTGCSQDQITTSLQGAAQVLEACEVEVPDMPGLEALILEVDKTPTSIGG